MSRRITTPAAPSLVAVLDREIALLQADKKARIAEIDFEDFAHDGILAMINEGLDAAQAARRAHFQTGGRK
jgi:hypothetical protein